MSRRNELAAEKGISLFASMMASLLNALTSPTNIRLYVFLFCLLIGILPVVVLLKWLHRQRNRDAEVAKSPLTDDLLRHPGQSATERAENLREQLGEVMLTVSLAPLVGAMIFALNYPENILIGGVIFTGTLVCAVYPVRKVLRLRQEIRNHELGAQGERAVAQHLDSLKTGGAAVFHDIQMDGWNLDHVVVTEGAVFCVETKTRRKRLADKGRQKITYKNGVTQFPWGGDSFGVDQARRQARQLGEWLSKEVGLQITPFPILTFPGWWVDEASEDEDLIVCNPGQIGRALSSVKTVPLRPDVRNRILNKIRERALCLSVRETEDSKKSK